ncbi:SCP-like protein [Oesophagostomum dentatum]|uniref:SCP-like protein n=1 Tax=Oesophagostomum dentatum TaxID=61180 RepID=A0A0B1SMY6_OESDE|nr:SCP-like protein [Oesophagostomum dentatum]
MFVSFKQLDKSLPACSNNGITDADRKLFLDYHNEARLRVAKGIEPNKVGYMNPAKNMYKLQWDCEMEQQAQDSIADCMEGYSSWDMGQNILMWESDSQITDPSAFINATLDNWWSSGKQYGVTDSENRYTSGYLYSFANMVYSEATKLGCAYKGCGNWLIMMCLYNATGFYYDKPMWETGEACKKAADCTTHANSGGFYYDKPMWETGEACKKAADCTTHANSGCDGGLCTVGGSAPEIIVPEVTTVPAVTAPTDAPGRLDRV